MTNGGLPWRPSVRVRASAVVLHRGHVLLQRVERDKFWALPGGGVEVGETSAQTVQREVQEETGEAMNLVRLVCITENFFELYEQRWHQIDFAYLMELQSGSALADVNRTHMGDENGQPLIQRWFPVGELHTLEYPLKPGFWLEHLPNLPEQTLHLTWRT